MPETEVVMSEDVYFSQFDLGIADVGKRPRVSSIPICDELEIHCRTGVGQGKAKRVDTKIRIAKWLWAHDGLAGKSQKKVRCSRNGSATARRPQIHQTRTQLRPAADGNDSQAKSRRS